MDQVDMERKRAELVGDDDLENVAGKRLAQIKDLLFGEDEQRLTSSLRRLEARLDRAANELRDEWSRRLADLERTVSDRLAQIAESVEAERREREGALQEESSDLRAVIDEVSARITAELGAAREAAAGRDELALLLERVASSLRREAEDTAEG